MMHRSRYEPINSQCPACLGDVVFNCDGNVQCEHCSWIFEIDELGDLISSNIYISCPFCFVKTYIASIGHESCSSCGTLYYITQEDVEEGKTYCYCNEADYTCNTCDIASVSDFDSSLIIELENSSVRENMNLESDYDSAYDYYYSEIDKSSECWRSLHNFENSIIDQIDKKYSNTEILYKYSVRPFNGIYLPEREAL